MLLGKEAIMPLSKNVSANIRELMHAKKKRKRNQIIAIAYSAAKMARKRKYG